MKIAYLFLTYDNIVHKKQLFETIGSDNLYIHPKCPEKVDSDLKPHIIPHLVATSWGDISIVRATISLLREAYHDRNNKWFMLMSQDCYPVATYTDIHNILNSTSNSMFDCVAQDHDIYKTSQWWALTRSDVEIILRNYGKFDAHHHNFGKRFVRPIYEFAFDEIYFLTLLRWVNPKYVYTQATPVYTRWLHNIHMHHPAVFNKLTEADMKCIIDVNAMFIRKTTTHFQHQIEKVGDSDYVEESKKRILVYLYIHNYKHDAEYETLIKNPYIDVVCIVQKIDLIPPELLKKSLHVYVLPYRNSYGVFLDIYYNQEHYWKHWGGVWFIYPNFVLETGREYNVCTTYRVPLDIPKNKSGFRDGQELPNIAAFHLIQDGNQNISFWLVNTL